VVKCKGYACILHASPSLHLLQARPFSKAQPLDATTAVLWSVEESGNLVDLTKNNDDMLEVKKVV
jgi:hypothetical protein